jgi:YbbR domain-containing protein
VSGAVVGVSLDKLEGRYVGRYPFEFYDGRGEIVSGRNIRATVLNSDDEYIIMDEIIITIPLYKQKKVPIRLSFVNIRGINPADITAELSAQTIILAGEKDVIDAVEYLEIGPFDADNMPTGEPLEFEVSLPGNLMDVEGIGVITATVTLPEVTSATVEVVNYEFINRPIGTVVNQLTTQLFVEIIGEPPAVEAVTSENIIATADLANALVGARSEVRLSFEIRGYRYIEVIGEHQLVVELREQ